MKSRQGAIPETVTEKSLEKVIGTILTNSKDWEKGRIHKITENILTETNENVNKDDDLALLIL